MATQADAKKAYVLDGFLLEACSCMPPCPCWIGDDPDGGNCVSFLAHHISQGQINGVDVSNLTVAQVVQIPGNVLAGNWRSVFYVDDRATPEQRQAILDVWTGKIEGPLAGLAGERLAIIAAPIQYDVQGGKGQYISNRKKGESRRQRMALSVILQSERCHVQQSRKD